MQCALAQTEGLCLVLETAQHSVHPTGGTRRVFKQVAWLQAGSGKMALSPPAHPRVTHPVGRFITWNLESGQIFSLWSEKWQE